MRSTFPRSHLVVADIATISPDRQRLKALSSVAKKSASKICAMEVGTRTVLGVLFLRDVSKYSNRKPLKWLRQNLTDQCGASSIDITQYLSAGIIPICRSPSDAASSCIARQAQVSYVLADEAAFCKRLYGSLVSRTLQTRGDNISRYSDIAQSHFQMGWIFQHVLNLSVNRAMKTCGTTCGSA
jgi:hypothetical protein